MKRLSEWLAEFQSTKQMPADEPEMAFWCGWLLAVTRGNSMTTIDERIDMAIQFAKFMEERIDVTANRS